MGILIVFGILFVVWILFSKTKSQDLKSFGAGISKTINTLNNIASHAEHSSKTLLFNTILKEYDKKYPIFSAYTLRHYFKGRPDLHDLVELEIIKRNEK